MITATNPFIYSRPLSPEDIIDRDDEVRELLTNAIGGHFVRLFAPRKYGKTSLLERVLRDGEGEGLIPILVDMYGISSVSDVTVRFERAYSRRLKGSIRARVERFLQQTGIGLSLGAYGISAKLQLDARFDPLPALHELLDLPLQLEEGGGYRALIGLDEFQDVGKVPDLDALLRSHIQYQGEVASYIFAGSEPGLMEQLFENKDRPLYGSAVPMRLGRLGDSDIASYMASRFADSDRDVGEAINPLLASARGHPQRAMLLAHRLWVEVEVGERATFDDWRAAHAKALAELHPEFDARWRGLDTSEQKALRAIIASDGSPYRRDVRDRLGLTKDMLRRALPRLAATAEIESTDDGYRVVDPLFAEWTASISSGSVESQLGIAAQGE
jgi:uncharacterized protein